MTDKAYIVANKEQELDILKKFKGDGIYWNAGEYATEFIPSEEYDLKFFKFPYALVKNNSVYWSSIDKLKDTEIVYDGRKEEKMYKVTQEFIDALGEWKDGLNFNGQYYVDDEEIFDMPLAIYKWWKEPVSDYIEQNNRLIAIVRWVNGADVFEVEEPHKFVVRSDKSDRDGDYTYVAVENDMTTTAYLLSSATKFDTREEAQEWANSHQVVVEIDEYGNEVE